MKKLLSTLCISMICSVLLSLPVAAHSGMTDPSGGHYDSNSGEYHYHHGYPAHSHYDADGDGKKDCPYNFEIKVDKDKNKGSYGNSKNDNQGINSDSSKSDKKDNGVIIYLLIAPIMAIIYAILQALSTKKR